jgi:DNA-binding Lrp family transcriptional regulator
MNEAKQNRLKPTEIKLLVELMKDSQRSDRELARVMGFSQPTISRIKKKLVKTGMIKEFTIIRDFARLGYEILAVTLIKRKRLFSKEELAAAKKFIEKKQEAMPLEILMFERGVGMNFDGVIIGYHKDYSSFTTFLRLIKETGYLDVDTQGTFFVDLNDEIHFFPLSLSRIAQSISAMQKIGNKP